MTSGLIQYFAAKIPWWRRKMTVNDALKGKSSILSMREIGNNAAGSRSIPLSLLLYWEKWLDESWVFPLSEWQGFSRIYGTSSEAKPITKDLQVSANFSNACEWWPNDWNFSSSPAVWNTPDLSQTKPDEAWEHEKRCFLSKNVLKCLVCFKTAIFQLLLIVC